MTEVSVAKDNGGYKCREKAEPADTVQRHAENRVHREGRLMLFS